MFTLTNLFTICLSLIRYMSLWIKVVCTAEVVEVLVVLRNLSLHLHTKSLTSYSAFVSSSLELQMRSNLKSETDCWKTCLKDYSLSASDASFCVRKKCLLYSQPLSILMRTHLHISRALIHAVVFWRLLHSLSHLHPERSWGGAVLLEV